MNAKKLISWLMSAFVLFGMFSGALFVNAQESTNDHIDSDNYSLSILSCENDFITPGDFDSDGNFNSQDLAAAKKVLLGIVDDEKTVTTADCTGDYKSDILDAVRLKKHIVNYVGAQAFTYTLTDGIAVITGFAGAPTATVTIPCEIDGCPVKGIADGAFKDCSEISSVLMPASITEIGESAFENCTSLTSIALPDSIETIGRRAFYNCGKMFAIRLSGNITVLPEDIFKNCLLLSVIDIPEDVTEIAEGAFSFCESLVEINIPKNVTVLNDNTFYGCSKLLFVGLPENLQQIKCYTFYGCDSLQSITIPITVVTVGDCAFSSCASLLSVVVPYETAFGSNVFTDCPILVVKGCYGTDEIDAAVKSGVSYELMSCGHSSYVVLYAVNPTCRTTGYSGDKYCTECGKIEEKGFEIAQTAHITELRNVKSVSCEEYGYSGDIVCKECGITVEYGYYTKPLGHYAAYMPGYVAPTCTADGNYGVFVCERCNKQLSNDVIPAKGHAVYTVNCVHADCKNDGYTGDRVCFDCGEILSKGYTTYKGDHYFTLRNIRYASCTAEGYTGDYVCKGCGLVESKGSVTAKKAHIPTTDNYKAATCTEHGFSGDSYCYKCHTHLQEGKELPILGHRSVLINYREATCTHDGYSGDQICSVCNVFVSVGKKLDKKEHSATLHNQKDCTKDTTGYTGDLICDICGTVIEKGKVIPIDHEHIMIETGAKEPTCKEEGNTANQVCEKCGYTIYGEVIEKLPHIFNQETVEPTCTTQGYVLDSCENCDCKHKHDYVDALGHDMDEEWSVEEATCTQDGKRYKNCSRCDKQDSEILPALGHTETERFNIKDADCERDGYTGDYNCAACGEVILGQIIPALGHSYSDWSIRCHHDAGPANTNEEYAEKYRFCNNCAIEESDIIAVGSEMYTVSETPSDCITIGVTEYTCKFCNKSFQVKHPAWGHDYKDDITDPTCTEAGCTTHTCRTCNYSYTDSYTPAVGHNYANGICTVCGEKEPPKMKVIESAHPYSNNSNVSWTESISGADQLFVTFSSDTETENKYDYICIYDKDNAEIGKYTGTSLASKTIIVPGDTVTINLTSDGSVTKKGFTAIISNKDNICSCGAKLNITVTSATCSEYGKITYSCDNCGYTSTEIISELRQHDWNPNNGSCRLCGKYCTHEDAINNNNSHCDVCGGDCCEYCASWDHRTEECPNHCSDCGGYGHSSGSPECPNYCFPECCPDCGMPGHSSGSPECPNYHPDDYCPDCGMYGHTPGSPECPNYCFPECCPDCGEYGHTSGSPECPNYCPGCGGCVGAHMLGCPVAEGWGHEFDEF